MTTDNQSALRPYASLPDADIFDENEYPLISRKAALKYLGVNTPLAVITRGTLSFIRQGLFHGSIKEEYALAMDIYQAITASGDALEAEQDREHSKPPEWPATVKRDAPKMGRDKPCPCPCGSGQKHKKCCLNKDLALFHENRRRGI
jgi:hypothetical protein